MIRCARQSICVLCKGDLSGILNILARRVFLGAMPLLFLISPARGTDQDPRVENSSPVYAAPEHFPAPPPYTPPSQNSASPSSSPATNSYPSLGTVDQLGYPKPVSVDKLFPKVIGTVGDLGYPKAGTVNQGYPKPGTVDQLYPKVVGTVGDMGYPKASGTVDQGHPKLVTVDKLYQKSVGRVDQLGYPKVASVSPQLPAIVQQSQTDSKNIAIKSGVKMVVANSQTSTTGTNIDLTAGAANSIPLKIAESAVTTLDIAKTGIGCASVVGALGSGVAIFGFGQVEAYPIFETSTLYALDTGVSDCALGVTKAIANARGNKDIANATEVISPPSSFFDVAVAPFEMYTSIFGPTNR